jgi:DNA-binding NtrC family response regulator
MRRTILVVDDMRSAVDAVSRMLTLEGFDVLGATGGEEALALAAQHRIDAALLDVQMPGMDGLVLLEALKARDPGIAAIMMSAHATVERAVRATRAGAHDFLEKPLTSEKVLLAVSNVLRLSDLERETADLRQSLGSEHELVGVSAPMVRLRQILERVAASEGRVLLTGESGTGKELAARMIHRRSPRADAPFITVNCAAIPSELFESELFGHEKGAFTGAVRSRPGKFEQAHHGTLFLDEIGEMPAAMQAKLLRVLESGEVERVGGTGSRKVDVRIVSATNIDLAKAVARGRFRDDLFHRLNVVPVRLPALRERPDDFPVLVDHLLERLSQVHGKRTRRLAPAALARLAAREWPGNVRELRNALERLVILAAGDVIDELDVDAFLSPAGLMPVESTAEPALAEGGSLRERLRVVEREIISRTLDAHGGNVTATARALGLERSHLHRKIRELGVEREDEAT